jgi:hypothetical protein
MLSTRAIKITSLMSQGGQIGCSYRPPVLQGRFSVLLRGQLGRCTSARVRGLPLCDNVQTERREIAVLAGMASTAASLLAPMLAHARIEDVVSQTQDVSASFTCLQEFRACVQFLPTFHRCQPSPAYHSHTTLPNVQEAGGLVYQANQTSQSGSDLFVSVAFTLVIGLLSVVTLGVSSRGFSCALL